jgi:hypothetical protein
VTSLSNTPGDRIQITGDVVRRPAHAWTPTVHAFLRHLRSQGLECVPEPLGIEHGIEGAIRQGVEGAKEGGVETLGYLPGASGRDGWFAQHSSEGLTSAAQLLREIHDASVGWVPPPDARWAAPPVPGDDLVLCHGDAGPWNFVWDGTTAIGLIDWDFLHPAPRADDVAYALRWFAPARSDEHALEWHHFPVVPDRAARIEAFLAAYAEPPGQRAGARHAGEGHPGDWHPGDWHPGDWHSGDWHTRDWVEAIAARIEATVAIATALAHDGVEPQRTWLEDGDFDIELDDARWVREHRHLLE